MMRSKLYNTEHRRVKITERRTFEADVETPKKPERECYPNAYKANQTPKV